MTATTLTRDRYLALIDHDTTRLLAVAEHGLAAEVPSCPGWSVADLVEHVAMVYAHKVRVMADGAFPKPWPPQELQDREPIGFLRESYAALVDEFGRHDLTAPTATFGQDKTIAFWVRRMALEVAIHRRDAELAHDEPTPIDDELAADGVDEMLRVMLGGDWWGGDDFHTEHPVEALVAIEAGGHRWLCDVRATSVGVTADESTPADLTISGDPASVFLWVWGRRPDGAMTESGRPEAVEEFRMRLVEVSD